MNSGVETAPRRVGIIATRAFPDVGGIESHVDSLLAHLDARDWSIDVVVTDCTGALPVRERRHNVLVRRHRAYPRSRDWYISPGLFLDVLRGRRDLLHIHGVNALVPPVAMLAAILGRTPFVVTLHSGGANTEFRRRIRSTQWRVLGPLLRRAQALIAVSSSESSTFTAIVRGAPIPVIRNGSLELTAPSDAQVDPDLVLSVGRLEQYKGHDRVIKAMPLLLASRPTARLRILGTGPFEAALHELVVALGLQDRVTISSVPPHERAAMAREMASAAAVALLSDYEAHPVVVMEAVSLGRPVVARRNSGFVELIDDGVVHGIADTADEAEIAAALAKVMVDPRRELKVSIPTWGECALGVDAVYRKVLGMAPRPADG